MGAANFAVSTKKPSDEKRQMSPDKDMRYHCRKLVRGNVVSKEKIVSNFVHNGHTLMKTNYN